MARRVHRRFEVVKGVGDFLMGQDDAGHLHVNAARKAEQGDVRHWVLQAAASLGFTVGDISPQALGPASGRSAVLGQMPWGGRATAFKPDNSDIGSRNSLINRWLEIILCVAYGVSRKRASSAQDEQAEARQQQQD